MENELMNPTAPQMPVPITLEGDPAAKAIGYVVLGITVLGVCAMIKGYGLDFGRLHLAPAA